MPLPPLVEPVETLPETERGRTDRQRRLPEIGDLGQRRLAAARVLVIGAGGLGAPALTYLAAAGVGTIGIVDDDVVELSNLHRQPVHGVSDLGRPKVDSAAEAIAALAPDAHVERHRVRLDRTNARGILADYDLVVDGTDTFETRYLVDDVCAALGLPLVWATVLRFDAQLSVFWAAPPVGDGVRLRTLFPAPPAPGEVPSCAEAGVLGALCGQVGAMMAQEAVKLITGIGEPLLGRVLVIDALRARQREIPLLAAPAPVASEESGAGSVDAPNGADAPAAAVRIERVDVAGLRERLRRRASGTDRFVLLDVREPDEHAECAIPGSVLVPLGEVLRDPAAVRDRLSREARAGGTEVEGRDVADADADAGGADGSRAADTPILVHCRTDQRAQRAALALARVGGRTSVLDGGILAWTEPAAAPATVAEASTTGAPPPAPANSPTQEPPAPARRVADAAPAWRTDLPAQGTAGERATDGAAGRA
jgi:adenylyltransferase/sulfurtransferase